MFYPLSSFINLFLGAFYCGRRHARVRKAADTRRGAQRTSPGDFAWHGRRQGKDTASGAPALFRTADSEARTWQRRPLAPSGFELYEVLRSASPCPFPSDVLVGFRRAAARSRHPYRRTERPGSRWGRGAARRFQRFRAMRLRTPAAHARTPCRPAVAPRACAQRQGRGPFS